MLYIEVILNVVAFRGRPIPLMVSSAPSFQNDRYVFIAWPLNEKTYGDMRWGFFSGLASVMLFPLFFPSRVQTIYLELSKKSKEIFSHENDFLL